MATTTATITLSSTDLLSDELALSTTSTLTTAGTSTGVTQASGLSRKTTAVVGSTALIDSEVLYRADDYTADKANKVYIKNTSTTAAQYFEILITGDGGTAGGGVTELGRLYAGDWAFFPWTATSGTKETFVVTATLSSGAVAIGDSWEFDGIKTVSADAILNNFAAAVHAQNYPNWTTSVSSAAITFTARRAVEDGVITGNTAITGDVLVDLAGSNLTMPITGGTAGAGTRSESDIIVVPSVATTMVLEHMLFNE